MKKGTQFDIYNLESVFGATWISSMSFPGLEGVYHCRLVKEDGTLVPCTVISNDILEFDTPRGRKVSVNLKNNIATLKN